MTRQVNYENVEYDVPVAATAVDFHVGGRRVTVPVVINFTVSTGIPNGLRIADTASFTNLMPPCGLKVTGSGDLPPGSAAPIL